VSVNLAKLEKMTAVFMRKERHECNLPTSKRQHHIV
jgi:hypothetical protein